MLPRLRGAFCLVFMDDETLYAARDPQGIRPLVLGRLERGWVVASETAALDIVGASFVREIEPGELVAIDADGLRSSSFAAPEPKGCLFEYVYLARPDTTISGRRLHSVRVEVGRTLARELPVDADLVIPVPESGTPAAIGYAEAVRNPVRPGPGQELLRRTDVHPAEPDHPPARHPAQAQPAARRDRGQAAGGRRRLDRPRQHPAGPGPDAARGRGRRGPRPDLVAAGEMAVLLRHRLRHPRRADRHRAEDDEICRSLGADSLGYVSLDGLVAATTCQAENLCRACFDGVYPIELPLGDRLGKPCSERGAAGPTRRPMRRRAPAPSP